MLFHICLRARAAFPDASDLSAAPCSLNLLFSHSVRAFDMQEIVQAAVSAFGRIGGGSLRPAATLAPATASAAAGHSRTTRDVTTPTPTPCLCAATSPAYSTADGACMRNSQRPQQQRMLRDSLHQALARPERRRCRHLHLPLDPHLPDRHRRHRRLLSRTYAALPIKNQWFSPSRNRRQ